MKGYSKWLPVLTTILSVSMLLAACGGSPTPSQSPSVSQPAQGGTVQTPEKKVTVTMFHSGGFAPANPIPINKDEDPLHQMLEKAANIDLQITFVPNDQAKQKLNTMVTSGDTPDLIYMTDRPMAVQYYDQGIITDIESVLNSYPALKGNYPDSVWNALKYKGKVLGTPGYELVQGIRGFWIRNDWLKKLNLKTPTTPDELLQVMKAFTFNDPDGNGKNDTYGFVMGVQKSGEFNNLGIDALMLMYGVYPGSIDLKDGKVQYNNADPRMKEALAFINRMQEAKVVDPDWMTITDNAGIDNKFFSGKVGIVFQDWRAMELDKQKKMKEVSGELPDWVLIPPMKGPNGDQYSTITNPQSNMWSISTKAAKDPEKVKRIMTMLQYWFADKDAYPYFAYGIKGVNWDIVDGKPKINQENKANKELQDKYRWMNNYANNRRANDALYFNFTYEKTSEFQKINQQYVKPLSVGSFVTPDSADPTWEDRKKFMNESLLKFIAGKDSLNNWDNYLKTLDSKYAFQKHLEYVEKNLKDQGILK
ncbi:extracellular solute-binding protein [Paenibacillus sedimenti]|uniref:Extracellular solute-binding protein n=1 Tax=Paenibacillus sedimenti TaxID=2770274 RepID=A0A926KP84_9BACL|nr:extracellular solute-binding protein [Paenibacillus sedimenti]MBD0379739.1 extracellular solute-binding protein [Paenibacillus sedimenti]